MKTRGSKKGVFQYSKLEIPLTLNTIGSTEYVSFVYFSFKFVNKVKLSSSTFFNSNICYFAFFIWYDEINGVIVSVYIEYFLAAYRKYYVNFCSIYLSKNILFIEQKLFPPLLKAPFATISAAYFRS